MSLKLNIKELEKILELFYSLSGIKIVIFDEGFNEVISYPEAFCSFCREIRKKENLEKKCAESDREAFEKCLNSDGIYIYKCHAGLIEATCPLKSGNKIIGYMMFGQITDIKNKSDLAEFVAEINEKYNTACLPDGIKYKNKKQISAAAGLLKICTDYIILKDMVIPENKKITKAAKEYILNHLSEEIKIEDICFYAGTSRTKLYEIFKADCNMGIAGYIREKRLELAERLIKENKYSVAEIAEKSGFSDYNYFSRVFRKKYGVSPYKKFN